ncbi:Uncharacterised protein [Segatella copri]|nr:Uncharacterised protein [Segatella copri]
MNIEPSTLPMLPYSTSWIGSSPAACKPDMTTSLLKGKKLPARKADTSMPQ